MNAGDLVPAVRELFSQYPLSAHLSPEQVSGLLRVLCYVADDEPPHVYEVETALECLDIERGAA
jgi:hypothetical protein